MDNASADDTVEVIHSRFPGVKLVVNESNMGYAAAVNRGVQAALAPYCIASNSDVIYPPGAIAGIAAAVKSDEYIGALGVQQVFPGMKWQRSHDDVIGLKAAFKDATLYFSVSKALKSLLWKSFKIDRKQKEVGYVDGAMVAFPKEAYDKVGGWDEDYFFYAEETDFCYRLKKAGYKIVFYPAVTIVHLRGGTTKDITVNYRYIDLLVGSKALFCRKHYSKRTARLVFRLEMMYYYELMVKNLLLYLLSFFSIRRKNGFLAMKYYIKKWKDELKKL